MTVPKGSQVFISYAKEDAQAAASLHDSLHADGFAPWLDLHGLLPGQDWEQVIKRAIAESSAFLVLLSPRSIEKSGYVQKEIRVALEIAESHPEGRAFIIPVVLEPCEVPERLRRWQWLDLSGKGSYSKLTQALTSMGIKPARRKHLQKPTGLRPIEMLLYELFVRSGRYLRGSLAEGRFVVSQGHVLVVLDAIPKEYGQLAQIVADCRELPSDALRQVVPDVNKWRSEANKLRQVAMIEGEQDVVGLRSRSTVAYVNGAYWRLAQVCCERPTTYVWGTVTPIVIEEGDSLRMIVMPLGPSAEQREELAQAW